MESLINMIFKIEQFASSSPNFITFFRVFIL